MRRYNSTILIMVVVALVCAAMSGCPAGGDGTSTGTEMGKIPISTSSEEAKKEFLLGRELAENLKLQDSLKHFDKAIELDANFAYAELGRANASPTADEFFNHLNKASILATRASEGEQFLIYATEAGANGDVVKQKEQLDKLISEYPNSERAQFSMGGYYFGQQDYTKAIENYKKATELNDKYAPVYNILGYAYRQNGDFANAETAFKKYIELIPKEPNPYDSYGELLLKMGKFEDSIAEYRKALAIDPNFTASHYGIAANLMYMGNPDEARKELQEITDKARSDGDRATALFGLAALDVDSGEMNNALQNVDKLYALSEKRKDDAGMSGNVQTKGTILAEMGKYDEAKAQFERVVKITDGSELSQKIKENTRLFEHYNMTTVALGKKDMEAAKTAAEAFRKGAEESKNPVQVKQAHELAGMIALAEEDYDKAIAELGKASQQNPYNFYRLALAFKGKGDDAKAKEHAKRAAEFNSLPQLNYAFVRMKAKKMLEGSEAGS